MSPVASIVIPTRNRRATLVPLVEALLPQAGAANAEVVVVDNGSSDGTAEALATLVPTAGERLRTVVEGEPGATRARNAGARAARGPVLAFTDDDALPRPGWLAALLACFTDDRVGAAGGPVVLRFASPPPRGGTTPWRRISPPTIWVVRCSTSGRGRPATRRAA
jgi:glucosyl-dolichyl phosphate glucuronosyltransferase